MYHQREGLATEVGSIDLLWQSPLLWCNKFPVIFPNHYIRKAGIHLLILSIVLSVNSEHGTVRKILALKLNADTTCNSQ
jgi:hypothetical protein